MQLTELKVMCLLAAFVVAACMLSYFFNFV